MAKSKSGSVSVEQGVRLPERVKYPVAFPTQAIEEINGIMVKADWTNDLAQLGRAVWELQGAAQRIYFGDPDRQRVEASPIVPGELANELYKCRDLVHRGLSKLQQKKGGALDIQAQAACEKLLDCCLTLLAWLRKAALESGN